MGRGEQLKQVDLLNALASGQIKGACLDVFDTEPLADSHPFWSHPDIIVTPHISAEGLPDSAAQYVFETINKFYAGEY